MKRCAPFQMKSVLEIGKAFLKSEPQFNAKNQNC